MILAAELLVYFFVAAFGAAIFSFLNVVVYRVPKKISFVKGFSACPSCGHRLYGKDMVPVFSWIFLGGRCRYCKSAVSVRYTYMELLGAALAVGSLFAFPGWRQVLFLFTFFSILCVVAGIDADTMEIPNIFIVILAGIAVAALFVFPETGILERVIGIFCISVPMLFIALLIPGGFGGGDMKLMAVCGFFLGWKLTLLSFFIAVIVGGIYGVYLLGTKKKGKKDHFAFGPFLCGGMIFAVFFGNSLLSWYLGLLPTF